MSELEDFLSEAFEDHRAYQEVEAAFSTVTVKALPAEASVSPDLEYGGLAEAADGAVICSKVDLGTPLPKVGERLTIIRPNDEKYARISSIIESHGNPLITVEYTGVAER